MIEYTRLDLFLGILSCIPCLAFVGYLFYSITVDILLAPKGRVYWGPSDLLHIQSEKTSMNKEA